MNLDFSLPLPIKLSSTIGQLNSKNPTPNYLLIGENKEWLWWLSIFYANTIDLIYIDPPYNTAPTVSYMRTYARPRWQNMMRIRLECASKLLKPTGMILISINEFELAYLRIVMDEIFGSRNYLTTFIWQKGSNQTQGRIRTTTEYIICFAKQLEKVKWNPCPTEKMLNQLFTEKDEYVNTHGAFIPKAFDCNFRMYQKEYDYPIIAGDGKTYYAGAVTKTQWEERQTNPNTRRDWTWRWTKNIADEFLSKNWLVFKNEAVFRKHYQTFDILTNQKILRTLPFEDFIPENIAPVQKAHEQQLNIFGQRVFDYTKPVELISHLLNFGLQPNSVVLDFFAGSGTTGHAVMLYNHQHPDQHSQFICIQNEDLTKKNLKIGSQICYERFARLMIQPTKQTSRIDYFPNESLVTFVWSENELSLTK